MAWYDRGPSAVLEELETSDTQGLTEERAAALLEKVGPNALREKVPRTFFQRIMEQMKDAMVIILLIAAAISFALSIYNASMGLEADWIEPLVIILIVIVNAVLGVVQESKAEAALEALKNMSAPNAKVIRSGRQLTIPAADLVPGDLVELEAGDFVPADCRLLASHSLKCDEAALTGESVPAEKFADATVATDAPLGDRHNMIFSGCAVSYGRGRAVVVETAMKTEMGRIAAMLEGEEEGQTPLQAKLAQLGRTLGYLALGICGVIFAIGLYDKLPLMEMFMTAISLAVAAIPEGLPAIVTIVLAIGVQRMVQKNAIIRRLPAVETLGSASVICSDKTGTLTQNRMTLVEGYTDGETYSVAGATSPALLDLIRLGTLCTDGSVIVENGTEKHLGDPTETAIVAAALHTGLEKGHLLVTTPRVGEIPFDSDRKLMSVVVKTGESYQVIVKGAPDILLSRCVKSDPDALVANERMGKNALRVLAVAKKELTAMPETLTPETLEQGLEFVGLLGMIDPPRAEVKDSIRECDRAGIRTVMITGDHVITASAIAKELGILKDESEAITGAQLGMLTDEELQANIRTYRVYARVSPSDKIRIVKAWQTQGEIVAMTGDGVNDAPALKAADIGCAMGITGTDVAKGAADMTLTDDNFSTIVTAVREGRGIYDNIRKAIQFLLSCNLGEIVTVFVAMILWKESPLLPVQLLWINLVTDSLPALALGMEPVEETVMDRAPRRKDESVFAHGVGLMAGLQGLMIGLITLAGYYIGSRVFTLPGGGVNIPLGESMAFAVLAFSQLIHAFNIRSSHSLFKAGLMSNKYMLGAFAASLGLMLVALFVPFMQDVFNTVPMPSDCWTAVLGLSLLPLLVMELYKAIAGALKKR